MSIINATIENGSLVIRTVGHPAITVNPEALPPAIMAQAVLHGLKQKIVDAAALSRNPDNGQAASTADKYAAMAAVFQRLMDGNWNKPAGDGTGAGGGNSVIVAALVRMTGKTQDEVRAVIDAAVKRAQAADSDLSETKARAAVYAAFRANPKVAPHVAAVEQERAAKAGGGLDSDSLLAELA